VGILTKKKIEAKLRTILEDLYLDGYNTGILDNPYFASRNEAIITARRQIYQLLPELVKNMNKPDGRLHLCH
jgi:hypothetical protein